MELSTDHLIRGGVAGRDEEDEGGGDEEDKEGGDEEDKGGGDEEDERGGAEDGERGMVTTKESSSAMRKGINVLPPLEIGYTLDRG